MKALLEKVKYLQPTHRQPQGDSEKAKTPSRNPIFTTFTFHPSIPYAPNSKIKWILWAHKYFTNLKINLKAILSFLYPSNVKQLLVSVHLNY